MFVGYYLAVKVESVGYFLLFNGSGFLLSSLEI